MTALTPPERVAIVEVAPRDGFQSIRDPLPTADKRRCIEALLDAGVTRLEIGSFVSPKAIAQMADTGDLVAAFADRPGVRLSALVPNLKGAELALAHGIREVVYVVSVSESHNRSNVRRSPDESLEDLGRVIERLRQTDGTRLRLDLGTSFDCPFEGTVAWQSVDRVLGKALELAGDLPLEVALCDTTGRASPYQVADHFTRLRERHVRPGLDWAFHGHDTFGMGVANALFAIHHGATAVDSACAGLGGCPFAPGATGNTATEDLIHALHGGGVETGIDLPTLLEAADRIAALPGGQTASHLRQVPRDRVS
ncbi:hydroxymethylglutaryl-CoA lyase [Billgrantia gudaonensis]|uniref:Hydroxymethylglutaryl-CoA lyase n=1 Tax=Billgrantia gudaonensis TaxID=376427 RepID=A0A1G9DKZ5_9GAMM|nr:hydroxymethylglutaryl-CoA lyase [Halomonas gudaonensis]SDK64480.1 hydroxymethylglutaryl-CoA lyase [Halomonas gudaonensis]